MSIFTGAGWIFAAVAVVGFLLSATLEPGTAIHHAAAYPTVFGALLSAGSFFTASFR